MKVIPILKPDKESTNPENYRDINLSNVISKNFDAEYYSQISKYITQNDIINENHLGGISGLSTIDAIDIIHKNLSKSRLENKPSILISIDQSSAFPMISHYILKQKLLHIGFSINSVELLSSYLNKRNQSVYYNGSTSKLLPIGDNSCFQGTIMATLMYILYVLDQPYVAHMECEVKKDENNEEIWEENFSCNYVDDNNSEITSDKWDNLEEKAEKYLENQKKYHDNNELCMNYEKTVLMVNSKQKKYRKISLSFNGKRLNHSKNVHLLGLIYNDDLKFKNHIINGTEKKKSLILRIKQKITLVKKIKYWMTKDELKKVCNAYIQGLINYGITIWTKEDFKLIDKVEKLRIKVIREVYGYHDTKDMNNIEILNLFNWKTLDKHREIAENIKIHKIINTKKPIESYKEYTEGRNNEEIKYKYIKNKIRSHDSYNSIPYLIRIKNVKKFKLSYKKYRENLKSK